MRQTCGSHSHRYIHLMPPKVALVDPVLGPLTDDLLTPDVRVLQRARGHRFSSDDVATAFVAWNARPRAVRVMDLGCGLGSVLLLLAWKMPEATLVGIEAQAPSFALVERNVRRNDLEGRVTTIHGDLRDETLRGPLRGTFDLVTGTPPYFAEAASVGATDAQRAHARIEYRGGVEAYVATGAELMTADGLLVLCGDARSDARVERAANQASLHVRATHVVVPRAGRPPLFSIWELSRSRGPSTHSTMTLRDEARAPTRDADALRVFSGFPSLFARGNRAISVPNG